MALAHQLAVITRENREENLWLDMDRIFISDLLFGYMKDSLMWIDTRWNGKKISSGFLEGGFTVVDRKEIEKFRSIMEQWRRLFAYSPEEFYLTGECGVKKRVPECILVRKKEVMDELNSCIQLCGKAIERGAKLLYSEI